MWLQCYEKEQSMDSLCTGLSPCLEFVAPPLSRLAQNITSLTYSESKQFWYQLRYYNAD